MADLKKLVLEKIENDMIFVFEADQEEKQKIYESIDSMSRDELLEILEDELSEVCGTYEADCSKCPKQKECDAYIRNYSR